MLGSEGVRHLIALIAITAAVAVQTVATRSVVADHDGQLNTYGVRLLGSELAAPVSPAEHDPLALPPPAAEPTRSAATFFIPILEPPLLEPMRKAERRWLGAARSELQLGDVRARWPENRDSVGALIELTESDVLDAVRVSY